MDARRSAAPGRRIRVKPIRITVVIAAIALAVAVGASFSLSRGAGGESTGEIILAEAATIQEVATDKLTKTLSDHVNDAGMVDYAALKANPGDLNAYLTSIANLDPDVFKDWPEPEQIALWCNVYNAYTLKAIIDHYPIKASIIRSLTRPKNSIRQIPGVWDKLQWPVMGKRITLDAIEHETLRVQFDEPRIHAALVCAAMSCPPLRNEPYDGSRLDEQLDDQMVNYLADPNRFRIDRETDTVHLSSILKWYGEDFVKSFGVDGGIGGRGPVERAVLNAIVPHVSEADAEYLRTEQYDVVYLDYDWSLNEQT